MQIYFAKIYRTKIRASVNYAVSLEVQPNYCSKDRKLGLLFHVREP